MTDSILLGLVHEATPTADAIEQLTALGIHEDNITIMSSIPYKPEILGRRPTYQRLAITALIGALAGFLTGLFLTVGTPILNPLHVGGQPVIPIPPSLIILFELTMLGTMLATFAGLIAESRFPAFGREVYDHRITEGHIGILVQVADDKAQQAEAILTANGAHHIQRRPVTAPPRQHPWARLGVIFLILLIPTAVVLLVAYSVISIPIPSQMVDQSSIAYEMGPRLAAPPAAVPMQGPELIAGQPASLPVAASPASIKRGQDLFSINCAMCHGAAGKGDGELSGFFTPKPADLTSPGVASLTDAQIFMVITQGRGPMPSIAENLEPADRWDVINYVRTLAK
jgi:mono/diheme cytochrome c family protein